MYFKLVNINQTVQNIKLNSAWMFKLKECQANTDN